MALSADVEIATAGNSNQIRNIAGGAADVLYKGAMVNIGTDGKQPLQMSGPCFIPQQTTH